VLAIELTACLTLRRADQSRNLLRRAIASAVYPSERQVVDYEESRIQARPLEVPGIYDGGTGSPHLHRIKMQREKPFDADGLSGGPIFYVGGSPGNYFAGFVGITVRGSATSDYLHFIATQHLIDIALDAASS
jgi:hypothetical protein